MAGGNWDTASYATSSSGVTVSLATGTGTGAMRKVIKLLNIENLIGFELRRHAGGRVPSANTLDGGLGNDTVSFAHAASGAGWRRGHGQSSP